MKILLVEDDEQLAELLERYLSERHYVVDTATDGESGLSYARTFDYDLIVLDVVLPELDGIRLCRMLREQHYQMPILLLTALDNSRDKVQGLDAGADDYVVKPVGLEELLARIRALLRRGRSARPPVLAWGELRLDPATREVSYAHRPLSLTPKEYALLELFLRAPTQVFSRDGILERLWSLETPPTENTLRAHIKGLRTKLKAADVPEDPIETVYGVGYRLRERSEAEPSQAPFVKPVRTRVETETGETEAKPALEAAEASFEGAAESASQDSTAGKEGDREHPTLAAIQKVWERVEPKIMRRVDSIERGIDALHGDREVALRPLARQDAHKLAGSLGTFGYHHGSHLARQIERVLAKNGRISERDGQQLRRYLRELRQQFERTPDPRPAEPPDLSPLAHRRMLVVDDDPILAERIAEEGRTWGMEIEIATTIREARAAIVRCEPTVVLLDLNFPDSDEDGLMLLEELARNRPEISVVVLTAREGFEDRLAVSRLGSQAYLQKPLPTTQILEVTLEVMQRSQTVAKVTIVDDDRQELELLKALLQPWGLQLQTLHDPRQFWQVLEASTPDLLVLDLEMPHHSGIELCQVVRNEPQWRKLPILFLTAHADAATVDRIFRAGADDYVSKPITGPELIGRLFNRLERTKLLQNLAELDALTGLANRRKASYDITRLLRTCHRKQDPLCFAILDIDRFKQVNDTYGHATGDLVLHRFGEMLRTSFRPEDIVGRWGGEEFVVVMGETTKPAGMERLTQVLAEWRSQRFEINETETLSVTCSAGVAQFPEDGNDLVTLYHRADLALYRAKDAGRDRVFLV